MCTSTHTDIKNIPIMYNNARNSYRKKKVIDLNNAALTTHDVFTPVTN